MALGISRKVGQSFYLETSDGLIDVKVTRLDRRTERVGVAIVAPKSVLIRRDDVKRVTKDQGGYCNERVRRSEATRRASVA
jgi:sRNA-binding carbon storage regulator CsrA